MSDQERQHFTLTLNGAPVEVVTRPNASLLSVLRDTLDVKGSGFGCGSGVCGACFVIVNGNVLPSCDTPMW